MDAGAIAGFVQAIQQRTPRPDSSELAQMACRFGAEMTGGEPRWLLCAVGADGPSLCNLQGQLLPAAVCCGAGQGAKVIGDSLANVAWEIFQNNTSCGEVVRICEACCAEASAKKGGMFRLDRDSFKDAGLCLAIAAVPVQGRSVGACVAMGAPLRAAPEDGASGGWSAVLTVTAILHAEAVRAAAQRAVIVERLSRKQMDVAALLLEQRTEQQIASRLDRSVHTVHDHVKAIFKRLGVRSRDEFRRLWAGSAGEGGYGF